jgi:tripartite-type tricarboxylate transporter receptor subunit TctC
MKLFRRQLLHLAAGVVAFPAVSRIARAQAYPTRPITLIVPFTPGGATDIYARLVASQMSGTLGQQLIIENIGGAGGTIGSARAMRAAPDGYTIIMGHSGTHAAAVWLYPRLAYRPDRDFEPIGLITAGHPLIIARNNFPVGNLGEFSVYAKENGPTLNMAHGGVGSNSFTQGLVLNSVLGIRPTYVPFSGNAPAESALLAGQVDYMVAGASEVGQQINSGLLKCFAIAGPKRNSLLPDIPTTAEAGLAAFVVSSWFALFAPKVTPGPILDRLSSSLEKALDDEKLRARIIELGDNNLEREERGSQPLARRMKADIARLEPIIKAANIKD